MSISKSLHSRFTGGLSDASEQKFACLEGGLCMNATNHLTHQLGVSRYADGMVETPQSSSRCGCGRGDPGCGMGVHSRMGQWRGQRDLWAIFHPWIRHATLRYPRCRGNSVSVWVQLVMDQCPKTIRALSQDSAKHSRSYGAETLGFDALSRTGFGNTNCNFTNQRNNH